MGLEVTQYQKSKLTKTERAWWKEYNAIGCADATQALRNVYKKRKVEEMPTSIGQMAHQIRKSVFKKLEITDNDLMDSIGLTDDYLFSGLKKGIEANRAIVVNGQVQGVADFQTRHKYLETAFKLRGRLQERVELTGKDGKPLRIEMVAGIGFLNKPKEQL